MNNCELEVEIKMYSWNTLKTEIREKLKIPQHLSP